MGDPDLRIDAFTDIGSKINVKTLDGDVRKTLQTACLIISNFSHHMDHLYGFVLMQEIKAKVFGYGSANESDSKQKVLVLHDQGSSPFLTNISIIKEDCIESFSEYEKAEDGDLPPLPLVDENRSREREARAIRVAEIAAANIGVGVTEEAQEVFNALAKTLPCTWQGTAIVVMDEVWCC